MAKMLLSARRNLHAWRQLTWIERRRLIQAWVLLPLISFGLRLFGLRRLQRLLRHGMSREVASDQGGANDGNNVLTECQNIAKMTNIAVGHSLFVATCLHRSLVLWWLLGREGFASDLHLGARKAKGQFEAHAWVEYQGTVLNDTEDVHERFATFDAPVTEAS